jgi:hypothetical protein
MTGMEEIEAQEGNQARSFKELQKLKKSVEARLDKVSQGKAKDEFIQWRELGVDDLNVDEAHEFKNLFYVTKRTRVAGLGDPSGSMKAFDLYLKTEITREINGSNRGVTFLTGTPISNSIAEMYTMFRYVSPNLLRERNIELFDGWAAQFADITADWELDATAQKYTLKERFRKFQNVPELMGLYKSFADTITLPDLKEMKQKQGKRWPTPKLKGGKPENVIVERTELQEAYMASIVKRAQAVSSKQVDPTEDNMLKITNDARLSALDMRIMNPLAEDDPSSKPNVAVGKIKEIYDLWDAQKGTQLVFMDLSTPKGSRSKRQQQIAVLIERSRRGDEKAIKALDQVPDDELTALQSNFSVYDDMRTKLVTSGIPNDEIAFIHDYNTDLQKAELFASVRSGKIRVLFGSTFKMGAGMNVQNKLVALHHMDAPWRPSDLQQREGRIIRRGNEFFEADPDNFRVRVLRYSTEATYDARMWQIIEAKANFVEQMYAGASGREVDDIAGEAANAAEMKAIASGNPLMLEQVQLAAAINKLQMSEKSHRRRLHQTQSSLGLLEGGGGPQGRYERGMASVNAKIKIRDAHPLAEKFSMTIGRRTYDKHAKAGKAIEALVKKYTRSKMFDSGTPNTKLFDYRGFEAWVDTNMLGGLVVQLKAPGVSNEQLGQYARGTVFSGEGLIQRAANVMTQLDNRADYYAETRDRENEEIKVKREAVTKPFRGAEELKEKKARQNKVLEILQREDDKSKQGQADEAQFQRTEPLDLGFGKKTEGLSKSPGQVTYATRQLEAAIKRHTGHDIEQATYRQVEAPKSVASSVKAVQRVFGKRVVFFRAANQTPFRFNGVTLPRDPKTIYVNIDSKNPFMGVVGHELLHTLRTQQPELYDQLADLVRPYLKRNGLEDFADKLNAQIRSNKGDRKLSGDKMFEEMVANIVGEAFLDPAFTKELARADQSLVKRILDAIMDILKSFQAKAESRNMGSSRYFNDLQELVDQVQDTLRQFEGKGTGKPGAPSFQRQTEVRRSEPPTMGGAMKSWWNREFTAKGNLPDPVFAAKIATDNEKGAEELHVGHLLKDFDRAVKKGYGKSFYRLSENEVEALNGYLAGEGTNVPDAVKDTLG